MIQATPAPSTASAARAKPISALCLKSICQAWTASPLAASASLAQAHPALLSPMLVLLMGALGALLYLFPAYLNRPAPVTMAEIAVRLIFGMCAALAFYELANAMQAAIDAAKAGANTPPMAAALREAVEIMVQLFDPMMPHLAEE